MNDHVQEELEAYALGAVDRAEAERIAAHLGSCASCRGAAAALAEVVGTLPDVVPLREPRAGLRERVLAAARGNTSRPETVRRTWSVGRVRPWPILLAGLTAAVIVLGAADLEASRRLDATSAERDKLSATLDSFRQGGRWWYMVGKDGFAGSGGVLVDPRAEGHAPFVLFHDLPRLPAGKILTVWFVSPDSTWARAAAFRPDGQSLQAVMITMNVSGFDRCAVTVEDSSWGPRKGSVVMESRIAPPPPAP
ncbi:MAG TPA: anti-sigma factor [Candidatus Limnocylindria bacterium]|jgi:hypothetical protein|nr:anti-sigma factor [Candidatus Limnocylindria bacterium]